MWVKGSGGDLGTLTPAGLAVLRLDRLRALGDVYPGVDREDEMVAAFDYCLHGKGGAAPSIDTAMHGLVPRAHVDHLHPDSGIALAAAADGEKLTRQCFGDRVAWVPWRRPGFQLGLDIAADRRGQPAGHRGHPGRARHHRVGRDQRRVRGPLAGDHPAPRRSSSRPTRSPTRSARSSRATSRCLSRAARPRGRAGPADPRPGLDRPPAGRALHRLPRRAGLPGPGQRTRRWPRSAPRARITSCAPRCGRCCSTCRRTPPIRRPRAGCASCTRRTGRTTAPTTSATRTPPRRRCAARTRPIVLVPGVGMFSFGADAQTARVAGEFYLNAINVMRGAEAVSAYQPIPESEKFRIEYWELEEAKLAPPPEAEAAGRADRAGHRGRFRHRPGHRAAARRRGRLRGRGRPRRRLGPRRSPASWARGTSRRR